MTTIPITLPAPAPISYEVRIAPNILAQLGPLAHQLAPAPSCGLITDSHVAPHYLQPARDSLIAAGFRVIEFIFPAGESSKTLLTVSAGLDVLLNSRVERATPIIALGGGVVGDLAGFIAATLLRGVPFIQVPTTLLAAVDASVGGKVGVDHPAGKNLIGAFHQPRLVLTDVATFQTLPPRELRCGLAECIKHGIIRDAQLFAFIQQNLPALLACDLARLAELVAWNVRIKAAIVMQDPFEQGVRALLNLGHTFGHALEAVAGYADLQHGEAVALGTIAACRLATRRGSMTAGELAAVISLLAAAGLPTHLSTIDVEKVFATMHTDKKVAAGKIRLVLPKGIGDAEVVSEVADEDIRSAIASLAAPTSH